MLFEGLNRFYHIEDIPEDGDRVSEFAIGLIIGVVIIFCIFLDH